LKYLEVIFKVTFSLALHHSCLSSLFSSQQHREKEIRADEKLLLEIAQLRLSFAPISIWAK